MYLINFTTPITDFKKIPNHVIFDLIFTSNHQMNELLDQVHWSEEIGKIESFTRMLYTFFVYKEKTLFYH